MNFTGEKLALTVHFVRIMIIGIVFIGLAVNQVNTMVDRSLASGFEDGVITALI